VVLKRQKGKEGSTFMHMSGRAVCFVSSGKRSFRQEHAAVKDTLLDKSRMTAGLERETGASHVLEFDIFLMEMMG
jgi:hypothetical protein